MRITIDLTRREYDALSHIAKSERRPLRDQAAYFVAERLAERAPQITPKEADYRAPSDER